MKDLMGNFSNFDIGFDYSTDIALPACIDAISAPNPLDYFVQIKGRANRAIQSHQKQLRNQKKSFTSLQELARWFLNFTEPRVTTDPINEEEIPESEWQKQGGKARLFLLVLPFIRSLFKACIRLYWEIEASLKAIKYLRSVIRQILRIILIDYSISALHRIFYIPHSLFHVPKDADEDHSIAYNRLNQFSKP